MRHIFQLDAVRAIAALLVVMFHAETTLKKPKYLGEEIYPFLEIGYAGVQVFFVLSGFVIFLAHDRDREGSSDILRRFAIKRLRRIYPALWIVVLPLAAVQLASITPYDLVAALTLLPVEDEAVLSAAWTLRHEMLFYLLFSVFLFNRRIGLTLLVLWGVVGTAFGLMVDGGWIFEFLTSPNHLLFLLGMLCYLLYKRNVRDFARLSLSAGLILFVANFAVFRHYYSSPEAVFGFGLGAAFMLYGLVSIPALNRQNKIIGMMGESSYALYLINFPLISILCKAVEETEQFVSLPSHLYFWLIVGTCQIAAIVFTRLIEVPTLALFGRSSRARNG